MSDTLPDCMMPDGAEPCIAYIELRERIAELERQLERMKPVVEAAKQLCVTVPIPPNAITWELGVDILNKVQDILCPRVHKYQKEE